MKINKEKFIEEANIIYNNKYDYSKVEYYNTAKKVCIICPEHGEFWKSPYNHLSGQGCPFCSRYKLSLTKDQFIEKARKVHGDKYDYSKAEYTNNSTKLCIICPEHGEFWQTPNAHISAMHDCPKCAHQSYKYTFEEFKKKIAEKYPNIEVLSTQYNNKKDKGLFFCNCIEDDGCKHGIFEKRFVDVLRHGCPKCGRCAKIDGELFIKRSTKKHKGKYDYSEMEYKGYDVKVCIICPKHGEFWQTPHSHMKGVGCPLCSKEQNINETLLYQYLNENLDTEVVREAKFDWLGLKSLDLYIPKLKVAIEYQGEQHFEPIKFYGGVKSYNGTVARDIEKYNLCKENGVKLFYFSKAKNIPTSYIEKIYTDYEELLQVIKTYL